MLAAVSPLLVSPAVDFPAAARRYLKSKAKARDPLQVDYIVSLYEDVCRSGEVDVEFALTQMTHETAALTSAWSADPKRNPAGIGVTGASNPDGTPLGQWFETWADSVEAHVGLILAYRFLAGQGSPAQQRLINEILGLRPGVPRGIATTVGELAAKWAADPTYVDKLAAVNAAIAKA
jgi:hypothetical protein